MFIHRIYTIYTPNTPLNTPYAPHIRPSYKSWSSPGIFMTEFDFAPAGNSTALADEDDGVLISVLYNSTSDSSLLGFFDAKEMKPIALYPIEGGVVPFHAHGIVCRLGEECFTNP